MKINAQTMPIADHVSSASQVIQSIVQILPELSDEGQNLISVFATLQSIPQRQQIQEQPIQTGGFGTGMTEEPKENLASSKLRIVSAQVSNLAEQNLLKLKKLQQINIRSLWESFNVIISMFSGQPQGQLIKEQIQQFIQEYTNEVEKLKSVIASPRVGFLPQSLL